MQEVAIILLNYGIVVACIFTFETNSNSSFTYNNQNVVLDSSYLRLLYYCFFSNSLILSLYAIFAQRKIKNEFIHLLSKHNFNLFSLVINKLMLLLVKITFCSFLNILVISSIEKWRFSALQLLLPVFDLSTNKMALFYAGIICLISLSAITYLMIELCRSYWYSLQLNLILLFTFNSVTQYLFKSESITKL